MHECNVERRGHKSFHRNSRCTFASQKDNHPSSSSISRACHFHCAKHSTLDLLQPHRDCCPQNRHHCCHSHDHCHHRCDNEYSKLIELNLQEKGESTELSRGLIFLFKFLPTAAHQRKSVSRQTRASASQTRRTIAGIAATRNTPRARPSAITTVARRIQKRFRRCRNRTTRNWTIPSARSITRTLCAFWWKSTRSASTRLSTPLNSRANELKTNTAINRSPRKPVVNWMKS